MNSDQNGCQKPKTVNERFRHLALCVAHFAGTPVAFGLSFVVIVVWATMGPFYHYSDTWQLVINTGTTIVTFLMVFLIQNMQNRDAKAIHLKLDELIRAVKGARNNLITIENLSEEDLKKLEKQFNRIAEQRRARHEPAKQEARNESVQAAQNS
jgi:low affinity Fe/Cu permease